jgi:hypothetical protein
MQTLIHNRRHARRNEALIMGAAFCAFAILSACGGSDGSSSPSTLSTPGGSPVTSTPPPAASITWTQDSFPVASQFKDRCEVVRTGVDIEGNGFPDQTGTRLEEMFWLRSWSDETYLWQDEITDRDPNTFTNKITYFDQLKTNATTASGENKDDFHFSQTTQAYLEQRTSAATPSYGAAFVSTSPSIPRDVRVSYTEPSSPAAETVMGQANLIRGSRLITIDGIDVINGASTASEVAQLNAALAPSTAGESHTFTVRDPGAAADRTVTLTAANIAPKPVNRYSTIDTASGKVGYILFNTFSPFSSEQDITDAVRALDAEAISDLVIDLRYNGGGLLDVSSQLAYMVAGSARTSGKTFEQLQFNSRAGTRNPVTGAFNGPIEFYSTGRGFSVTAGTPLPSLDLPRVYILSTASTCSASEALVNGLRGVDVEVVMIGSTTCGKPFGFYPTSNCGQTYYTIQFQGVNDKGFGDYADGFAPQNASDAFPVKLPGCQVADDFDHELGNTSEALLAAALQHRTNGTCPAVPASPKVSASTGSQKAGASIIDDPLALNMPTQTLSETNRDLSAPGHTWGSTR